jgi:hypothetical protein
MNINLIYDSSTTNAPAGFAAAMNYVVNFFDTVFTNPVTINIAVGWGEIAGQPLSSGALGESETAASPGYTYSQIKNALTANTAQSATDLAALLTCRLLIRPVVAFFLLGPPMPKPLGSSLAAAWESMAGSGSITRQTHSLSIPTIARCRASTILLASLFMRLAKLWAVSPG